MLGNAFDTELFLNSYVAFLDVMYSFTEDTVTLGSGVPIEKGTRVYLPKDIWGQDAEELRPERWDFDLDELHIV